MDQIAKGGTLGGLVINAIARYGDRPAISDGRSSLTYRELGDAIGRCIAAFRRRGLERGHGVAVLSANRVEIWVAMSAALIMGMRYTPLHPMSSEGDQSFVVDDGEVDALIVEPAFAQRGHAIKARVSGLKYLLAFGAVDGADDLSAELATGQVAPLIDRAYGDDTAWLAYTGGTTGKSKGVMLPHRALVAAAMTAFCEWEWPADIRFLAATPVSHAAGVFLWPVMMRGGYSRLVQGFDAEAYCQVVEREKITVVFLVPTVIYALIDHQEIRSRYDLSSLDMIVYGAAPMSPDRLREGIGVFGSIFVQLYGQTEAPLIVTAMRKVDHDLTKPNRLSSCGRPTSLIDVRLMDSDMNEVGVGEVGEICLRGYLAMNGYWKRPDLTAEVFRDGWLHTGDAAVRDEEGFLYIVDRVKDMIISGGFNIYPREVEDALMGHPAVASAAVIGVPDPKWGEAVKAFVVKRAGAQIDEAALVALVKEVRGPAWAPKSIDFVDSLPVTGLGKIDRKALRAPFWAGQARSVA